MQTEFDEKQDKIKEMIPSDKEHKKKE